MVNIWNQQSIILQFCPGALDRSSEWQDSSILNRSQEDCKLNRSLANRPPCYGPDFHPLELLPPWDPQIGRVGAMAWLFKTCWISDEDETFDFRRNCSSWIRNRDRKLPEDLKGCWWPCWQRDCTQMGTSLRAWVSKSLSETEQLIVVREFAIDIRCQR